MHTQERHVCVVGDLMTDVIVRIPSTPLIGTDTPAEIATHPGGAAGNVASWLAHLGVTTEAIACVGQDPFGDAAIAALVSAGVVAHVTRVEHRSTGMCVITVTPDGERTMMPDLGANGALQLDAVPTVAYRPGGHLHLSGYSLLHTPTRLVALGVLDTARRHGMTVSIDASSAEPLRDVGAETFLTWCRPADLLLANHEESIELTGLADPAAAAKALLAVARIAVVKVGSAGAFVAHADLVAHRPALDVEAVDTTGAGDALTAGFLASWLDGTSVETALEHGIATAARAVSTVGGRP